MFGKNILFPTCLLKLALNRGCQKVELWLELSSLSADELSLVSTSVNAIFILDVPLLLGSNF